MSHSKRNTSRPVFTSHERALAKSAWSSASARLNRDSFLPFGSCGLCLEIAREPVSCQRGDVFCRECALANILAQKRELKRSDKKQREAERDAALDKEEREEEDRRRAVRDFEMTQAGLDVAPRSAATAAQSNKNNNHKDSNENLHSGPSRTAADATQTTVTGGELVLAKDSGGTKRKFELNEDELERTARADRARARISIENEKASKAVLPSFWTPSLTPDVRDSDLGMVKGKDKLAPTCPASKPNHTHPFSLHKLITIQFTEEEDPTTKDKCKTCPSCRKVLSNASAPIMAKGCGHVLCQKCVHQFLIPPKKDGKGSSEDAGAIINCFVCDKPIAVESAGEGSKHRLPVGLVALKSEGTGFSARGTSTVEKSITSFQC